MKVWSVMAGDVWTGEGPERHLVELPVPLEVPEHDAVLVQRQVPTRFLSFRHGGEQLEVPLGQCQLLTIARDHETGNSVVVDVEYPVWLQPPARR